MTDSWAGQVAAKASAPSLDEIIKASALGTHITGTTEKPGSTTEASLFNTARDVMGEAKPVQLQPSREESAELNPSALPRLRALVYAIGELPGVNPDEAPALASDFMERLQQATLVQKLEQAHVAMGSKSFVEKLGGQGKPAMGHGGV